MAKLAPKSQQTVYNAPGRKKAKAKAAPESYQLLSSYLAISTTPLSKIWEKGMEENA